MAENDLLESEKTRCQNTTAGTTPIEQQQRQRSIQQFNGTEPQDFILISEFSELEGPLPLAVVSEHVYFDLKDPDFDTDGLSKLGLEQFDFNAFVLRIVSVDQTSEQFEHPDLDATNMFSIPDDTQVYTTDAENQFFAFTHHLALFDINARGYVHPVALSYITCDPEKIVWRFEDFSERFNEVSRLMKKGNFSNFAMDLKYRLMDLEYTQKLVGSHDEEKQQCNISIEAMQQAITVTRLMVDTVESYLVQLVHESTPELLSDYSSTTTTVATPGAASGGGGSRKASDGFLATTPITPSNSLPETPNDIRQQQQLPQQQQQEGGGVGGSLVFPLLALIPQSHEDQVKCLFEEPGSDYEPKFVDTLHPVSHFERKLRSLAQLCQEPKQPQQKDQPYRISTTTSVATKRTSLPATVIPLASAIEPPRSSPIDEEAGEDGQLNKPTFASTINEDMYAEAIKCMTEMTHDFGFSSEILDLIEDEEMYLQPTSGVLLVGRTFVMNMKNPQPRRQPLPSPISTQPPLPQQQQQQQQTCNNNNTAVMLKQEQPVPNLMADLQDDEEEEDNLPMNRIHNILWHHGDLQSPGIQHLTTLKQLGDTLPHLIFALLTGRPVVVMSDESNKQRVQNTIQSLSVFIPSQPKIQSKDQQETLLHEWFEKKETLLTDVELDSIKLVGAAKNNIDASIYKLDISCLDISNERHPNLITSPLYLDGYWINQMMDRLKYFTSDRSFFAYLQTIFMAMALKAYIYHHMYNTLETNVFSSSSSFSAALEGSGLTKKWSVRRIMSYLRRIEEREDNHYQSSHGGGENLSTVSEHDDFAAAAATTDTGTFVLLPPPPPPTPVTPVSPTTPHPPCEDHGKDHHQQQQKSDEDESDSESSMTDGGMTLNERRGRRFLEQKLGIHGDDQNIVIYFSNSIL
ncbi:hypothetical protein BDA99DRAFT_504939 [Phascolomyces articulosus]|uniref:UDENN FLCN/SMCR8-type domain-containing protein n=1 Tax=Phascolomyces articulosus TaxID=60185 RepID=A0AAD5KEE5_9FUNG|nr:hypothetical protein BDA99DRAFT_504939 [Phascolomyces articulosus]